MLTQKKSFDVEQQLANEHLPVKSDLSWDLIVNEVDERIAETKLYPRDGIEWTFSVYTQLENSVPYYWIGSGYDAFCGDDVFCAAEEFVKAEICGHTPNARVSIATNILERGEIKFLKLGGESVEIPFDRTIFLFVDDKPGANWSHPCRYVFLNETLTEFVVYYQMNPPRIFDLSSDQRIRLKCCDGESSPYQTLEQIQNSVYSSAAAMASNALSYSGDVSKSYFVLISGGVDPELNGIRFWADTAMMYSTLTLKYGVPKSHIYVYVSDGTSSAKDANLYDETNPVLVSSPTDLDGDGQSDVDGAATKSNVSSIFSTLRGQLTSSDQLFVFITSHGSPDGVAGASNYGCLAWLFSTSGSAYFYDTDLHDWTKGFSCPVAFAIETCYSGGFIDDIRQTANRVIATACNHYEKSFGTTYVSESWGSGGAGQIRAYNNWAMPFISAIRGYIPKSAYTPDTYPWQDGISCDADNNRDGYISFSEAKAYALSNDSSAIGGNEHPQYAESTSGLGASFFLVKKPAVVSPVNNNFASATAISGNSGATTGSNVGATAESGEPLLSAYSTATTTVWWKWTAPSSGSVRIDTVGSSFDTQMGIFTGSSLSSLTLVKNDDDSGANATSICTFDCTGGITYYICVGGYQGRTGTIKLNWNLTPQVVAPSTPTGVSATDGSYTDYARVTWSAASGATSYNLYRSTTTSRPSTATKTGVTSPYNDTTATPGTKYYYWIAAVNSAGSSVSSYDTGYRAVSLTLGKSSDSYGASSGSGSASVTANTSWSASANVDWINFGTKSGSGNGTLTYTVAANTSTSSRTGTITVTAGSGTSYPATRTITVSQAMGAPSAPTSVSATDGSYADYARVTWSAASGATSYNLYRSTTTSRPSTATKTGVTSPYNDTTATPGTKYYYWIAAVNSAGSSVSSYDTGYRAVSLTLGKSSDSYGASSGSGSASVTANTSWSASANVDWITFGTKSGSGNGTLTYTVAANTLTSSRTGTITVMAGSGTSYPMTRTITVSQEMFTIAAPTSVSATDGLSTDYVRVTWSAVNGATSYNIYRSITQSDHTLLATNVTSPYNDTTAIPGAKYYYRVASVYSINAHISSSYDTGYRRVSLSLDKSADSYVASGGSGSVFITANTTWKVSTDVGWITFGTNYASSSGTLTYTVAANTSFTSRTGTITVTAGFGTEYPETKTITVTQAMRLPDTPTSMLASDGLYTDYAQVTWSAVSGATSYNLYRSTTTSRPSTPFAKNVTSPYNDTTATPGTKYYYWIAAVNSAGSSYSSDDTGYRAVSLTLGKSSDSYGASGGSGSASVAANTSWSATTDASWITLGTKSGSGNGTLTYTVAANTSSSILIGTITVTAGSGTSYPATKTITVSQETASDFVIADGVLTKYKGSGGEVKIPSSVTSIGNYAFFSCSSMTSVIIPSSVTSIGYQSFCYCGALTSVTILSGLTSIEDYAFKGCGSLTSVTLPDGVMSIGRYAFYNCSALTSVTIPSSVTSIGASAFIGCNGLKTVYVSSGDTRRVCNLMENSGFSVEGVEFVDPTTMYTVTFNANGGSGTMTSQFITYGVSTSLKVNAFTKSGYIFVGWSKTAGGSAVYGNGALVSNLVPAGGSITLYAVWMEETCTIVFDANGGTGGTTITRKSGECLGTLPTPTLIGYKLVGWQMMTFSYHFMPDGTIQQQKVLIDVNLSPYSSVFSSVTYYAKWQPISYTVRFHANGGTGMMANQTFTYDSWQNLAANVFTRNGCTFAGWATTSDGLVSYVDGQLVRNLTSVEEDVSLYAVWNVQVVAPSAPTGVSATDGSYADYARVTWSAASGATSYNLYRSTTTSRPSSATKTGVTSPYNDTTATPGTKYYYWIAAVNSAGSSVSSYDTGYRAVSLTLGKSSDSYTASGGSGSASVTANTSWSASANVSWITFGTKSGSGNGTLTYTVAANTSTSSRSGTITVTAGSGTSYPATKTITVSQGAVSDFVITDGVLTKYTGAGGAVTIPSGVTSIGYRAFYLCSGLTSVTIPSSVKSIGFQAFYLCSGLTSVTIPSSVTSIGDSVFYGCSGLTSVTIPSSVTSIGVRVFEDCSGLMSVTIPSSVTNICKLAFYGCSGLTSVTIPSSVTSIGYGAFEDCSGLMSVTIPSSVTSIGDYAFEGCSSLTSINVNPANGYYCSIDGVLYNKDVTELICCPNAARSVTIPSSVTSISRGAFYGCRELPSVTMPSSVTSIDSETFRDCSSLTSVTIPSGVTSIGSCAFWGCRGLTSVTIPSSVTSIDDSAFTNCDKLATVYVEVGDVDRVRAMMSGKGVDVDKLTFVEIRKLIADVSALKEAFGEESSVVRNLTSEEELVKFNEFLGKCGITAAREISDKQKQYAYESFRMSAIMVEPQLFENEPKLNINEFKQGEGGWSVSISLKAGEDEIAMARKALEEHISVGNKLTEITAKPNIVARPSEDGSSLTFTIAPPTGKQAFIMVR